MSYSNGYQPRDPAGHYRGLAIVVLLHVLLAWALITGTARKGFELLKKPLEAVVIQEVIIPPPPPPPPPPPKEIKTTDFKAPKVEAPPPFVPPPEVAAPVTAVPAIVSTPTPPPAPPVIAPPPPPAPVVAAPAPAPLPAAPKAPAKPDIGIACPSQVTPEMPRKALQDGVSGVVKAQALIKDGAVKEVTILSGPRVFHAAVRSAMLQYKCTQDSGEVLATQEFSFKLE